VQSSHCRLSTKSVVGGINVPRKALYECRVSRVTSSWFRRGWRCGGPWRQLAAMQVYNRNIADM
jgi:hypothetical protein